jgi:dTDP-4-dehydrorhamnose 3,5-epimerase
MTIDGVKGAMIDGVRIVPKRTIADERGAIFHMLKSTDPEFHKFGEIYFSCGYPGVIKAWHIHKEMTLNNFCVAGMIMGELNRLLVQIPPGITNGYKAYGEKMAILANCASMPHDKNELIYIDPLDNDIPYKWDVKHG